MEVEKGTSRHGFPQLACATFHAPHTHLVAATCRYSYLAADRIELAAKGIRKGRAALVAAEFLALADLDVRIVRHLDYLAIP